MPKINRKKGPAIQPITQLPWTPPIVYTLDNGLRVYETNMGTQEVVRLELVFNAGRPWEKKPLAARTTASLLREGTPKHSAAEIAELLDFYGSTLSTPFNLDTSNVVLFSLNKHLDDILPVVVDMLQQPDFPETELNAFIQRNLQLLQEDLTKPDVVAYRQITELIFGEQHPYGYNSYPETYALIHRDDLIEHFERLYTIDNCILFVSGKIDDQVRATINRHLSQWQRRGEVPLPIVAIEQRLPQRVVIEHPNAVQTAIRIGRRMFSRHHPDYCGVFILNTVLGGYFGSRLMANIREEKGYTYNIYSSLDTMRWDGCLYVGTEVGNDAVVDTRREIYRELESLRAEPIDTEEMDMVRSYLLGTLLTMLDGPFNVSEVVRTMVQEDMPLAFLHELIETIEKITPAELQQLAIQYLNPADMWEVIVGVQPQ